MLAYQCGSELRIYLEPDGSLYHHGDGGPQYGVTTPAAQQWQAGAARVQGPMIVAAPSRSIVAGPGLISDPIYQRVAPNVAVLVRHQFVPDNY